MKIVAAILMVIVCIVALFLIKVVPAMYKAIEITERHPPMEIPMPVYEEIPGMEKYAYFCSDGGPFTLLPSAIKNQWKGVSSLLNPLSPKTDYGKACKVVHEEGSHGVINAYKHPVFVVDAPMMAMHKESDGDTLFIYALENWQNENLDDLIDFAVNATKEGDFVSTQKSVQCDDDGFVFMYAGDIYSDCMCDVKDVSAKAGTYNVSKALWKKDGNEIRIFKLSLLLQ